MIDIDLLRNKLRSKQLLLNRGFSTQLGTLSSLKCIIYMIILYLIEF